MCWKHDIGNGPHSEHTHRENAMFSARTEISLFIFVVLRWLTDFIQFHFVILPARTILYFIETCITHRAHRTHTLKTKKSEKKEERKRARGKERKRNQLHCAQSINVVTGTSIIIFFFVFVYVTSLYVKFMSEILFCFRRCFVFLFFDGCAYVSTSV